MSGFGSSVINKSNKKLAPKARSQRRQPTSTAPVVEQNAATTATEYNAPTTRAQDVHADDDVDRRRTGQSPATSSVFTQSAPHSKHARAIIEQDTGPPKKRRKFVTASDAGRASRSAGSPVQVEPQQPHSLRATTNQSFIGGVHTSDNRHLHDQATPIENSTSGSPVDKVKRARVNKKSPAQRPANVRQTRVGTERVDMVRPVRETEIAQTDVQERHSGVQETGVVYNTTPCHQSDLDSDLNGPQTTRNTQPILETGATANEHQVDLPAAHLAPKTRVADTRKASRLKNHPAFGEIVSSRALRRKPHQSQSSAPAVASVADRDEGMESVSTGQPHATSQGLDVSVNDEDTQSTFPYKTQRKRRMTPDGAEQHEIDPETMTMYDLCKDSRKGKKSKLEREFQEVDWSEVVRRRREAENRAQTHEANLVPEADTGTAHAERSLDTALQGPQLKLVNGQIVVDTSSLVVDRHAGARPNETQPAFEERDITRRVNSQSWINDSRRDPRDRYRLSNKSDPWSAEATDQFYSALRMFGTDFMMISKMFPGRTRRHIKLKFVREERAEPAKIKEALVGGSIPMDLQTYCKATGQRAEDYKDPEALEEELKAEEERQRTEIEKQKVEQAETQRKKQEAAAAKAASGRQRKVGDKGVGKIRKKKQDKIIQDVAHNSRIAIAADDAVVETIELQNGVPMMA